MKCEIQYDPGSLLEPPGMADISEFESWLIRCVNPAIRFDHSYLDHISKHHGGIPVQNRFVTKSGSERMVVRFLNFTTSQHPLAEYSVEGTWGLARERFGGLIPFAELFAGDMLCFDYSHIPARVVVWLHEESEAFHPVVDEVADSFDEFLCMLFS